MVLKNQLGEVGILLVQVLYSPVFLVGLLILLFGFLGSVFREGSLRKGRGRLLPTMERNHGTAPSYLRIASVVQVPSFVEMQVDSQSIVWKSLDRQYLTNIEAIDKLELLRIGSIGQLTIFTQEQKFNVTGEFLIDLILVICNVRKCSPDLLIKPDYALYSKKVLELPES